VTVEDAISDRIHRLIGRGLIEFSWQRPKEAADALNEAVYHLRGLAAADADEPERACAVCGRPYRGTTRYCCPAHAEIDR
jgi:hypothetical protein